MKCPKCDKQIGRRDNLARHLVGVHDMNPDEARDLVCELYPRRRTRKEKPTPFQGQKDHEPKKIIRLNRVHLDPNGKGYAELVPIGDMHVGHPTCDMARVQAMIDYCLTNHVYVIGMGDYIEAGLRGSVGDSVYIQTLNPQEQAEKVTEMFKPLADAGLLIGLHLGNHEGRIKKETSFNVASNMASTLSVPYLGYATWSILYVGDQSYTLYSLHGSTGSKHVYTKLKALVDIAHNFDADILAMGHVHELAEEAILVQRVDRGSKQVIERKKYLVLTGSYLAYDDSYAQEKGYPMGKLGSPKIKLFADKHDIHTST